MSDARLMYLYGCGRNLLWVIFKVKSHTFPGTAGDRKKNILAWSICWRNFRPGTSEIRNRNAGHAAMTSGWFMGYVKELQYFATASSFSFDQLQWIKSVFFTELMSQKFSLYKSPINISFSPRSDAMLRKRKQQQKILTRTTTEAATE